MLGIICCLTPHPALGCITVNTEFTAALPNDLVLCWPTASPALAPHIICKPLGKPPPWSLSFPLDRCQSNALILMIKWHTTHEALSKVKYSHGFNEYQNEEKKNLLQYRKLQSNSNHRRKAGEYHKGPESLQRPDRHMAPPDPSLLAEGGKLSSSAQAGAQPAVSHPFWTTTNTLI